MKKKKTVFFIFILLLVIIAIEFYIVKSKKKDSEFNLTYGQLSRGNISEMITATGNVEPLLKVDVGTQVSGIINKIYVDFNSSVHKGQLLAEMDKVTLQSELTSTQAEVRATKVEYEYQHKTYMRNKQLYEQSLISESDYDASKYNYERSKSSYEKMRSNLSKVERNLSYTQITSPIDGIIINRAVEEGQTVAAGFSTPTLFTIANDLKQMRVIADVDEADIGNVNNGQHVLFTVDAYPDDTFEGVVTQVRLEATNTSNVITYEVVIEAPNAEQKLKPGLTANVTIYTLEKKNIDIIPTRALGFKPDADILKKMGIKLVSISKSASEKSIWIKSGNLLKERIVKTGLSSDGFTEVISGLSKTDKFVIELNNHVMGNKGKTEEQSPFMPQPPGGTKKK